MRLRDVGIRQGRIAALGSIGSQQDNEVIVCKGLDILPGVIDTQAGELLVEQEPLLDRIIFKIARRAAAFHAEDEARLRESNCAAASSDNGG